MKVSEPMEERTFFDEGDVGFLLDDVEKTKGEPATCRSNTG